MNKFIPLVLAGLLAAVPVAADPVTDLYKAGFKADFDRVSQKLNDLAAATPDDKFSWKPVDGVRTVSEVYMHVAGANFVIAAALGVAPPAVAGPDLEQRVTSKAQVLEVLKLSQDLVRKALESTPELGKEVELFGGKRTAMGAFMIAAAHTHEHLGQSIAYARTAGITPPWSKKD